MRRALSTGRLNKASPPSWQRRYRPRCGSSAMAFSTIRCDWTWHLFAPADDRQLFADQLARGCEMDAVPRSFVWGGFTLALKILVGPSMTDACLAIPSLRAGKKHLVEAGECSWNTMEAKILRAALGTHHGLVKTGVPYVLSPTSPSAVSVRRGNQPCAPRCCKGQLGHTLAASASIRLYVHVSCCRGRRRD